MLAKILMCKCYLNKFQSEGNEHVKKLTHFHCKCKDKHLLYILFCEKHPHGGDLIPQMIGKRCTCANGCSH